MSSLHLFFSLFQTDFLQTVHAVKSKFEVEKKESSESCTKIMLKNQFQKLSADQQGFKMAKFHLSFSIPFHLQTAKKITVSCFSTCITYENKKTLMETNFNIFLKIHLELQLI